MTRKITAVLIIALAAGLGLMLSFHVFTPQRSGPPALQAATLIASPRALPAFTLTSAQGKVSAEQLKGHWTVVFIGFTHCPDICPTTLAELAKAQAQWASLPAQKRPRVLFLSVDPERDAPKPLAEYAAYFHKDTLAVTAQEPQLTEFTRALGLVYMKVPQGESYTMDHSSRMVLLNPNAELAGVVSPPLNPSALARDLMTLTQAMP